MDVQFTSIVYNPIYDHLDPDKMEIEGIHEKELEPMVINLDEICAYSKYWERVKGVDYDCVFIQVHSSSYVVLGRFHEFKKMINDHRGKPVVKYSDLIKPEK